MIERPREPGSTMRLETPCVQWLRRQPGRCPGCGMDIQVQLPVFGHADQCPFGPRAWVALVPDGTPQGRWVRNPS